MIGRLYGVFYLLPVLYAHLHAQRTLVMKQRVSLHIVRLMSARHHGKCMSSFSAQGIRFSYCIG